MGVFNESWQNARRHTEEWCLAAAGLLPNTTSPPHMEAIVQHVEIHPFVLGRAKGQGVGKIKKDKHLSFINGLWWSKQLQFAKIDEAT